MSRITIFKASHLSDGEPRTLQPSGASTDILAQHLDYSNKPVPQTGYRLMEFKTDDTSATFDHQGGVTHRRFSPWQVTRVDEYVANTGQELMDEVVVCYCNYVPLPEQDNPWVEVAPALVSVESFGGDVAAYEAWRATQAVTV